MGWYSRAAGRLGVLLAVGAGALIFAAGAFAHANVSPPVAAAGKDQLFTLAVPTEKEDATTSKVELTLPDGFTIDSFAPARGWTREVETSGSGEDAEIDKVTWSGGDVPHEEAAVFQFFGEAEDAKSYALNVRQTYSDGTVADWSGPASSDDPAPRVEFESSLGGGGGSTTLEIVALALGAIALVVAIFALVAGSGRRSLA
jgi:uncharacterized protein YcnI